ncbi:transcription factor SPEECHLESS-like [Wolffia australiana]
MDNDRSLPELFDCTESVFRMLESLDDESGSLLSPLEEVLSPLGSATESESPISRKRKIIGDCPDTQVRMSHITVERNRRKQMNEHLSVLKSLMPCFYAKGGDQASIIGGVVEYIKELQQVLQSLEAKKQRKAYSEVLSPRHVSSPRPCPLIPRPPPLSPKVSPCISPRTPQRGSPYKLRVTPSPLSPVITSTLEASPRQDGSTDLAANSCSSVANVEVKFMGANVLLKTTSPRIPSQALRIAAALDRLSLEILQVDIKTVEETVLNSFTIKIGIECELSAEDLANEVQQTFS